MLKATYRRLRDGSWGVAVAGRPVAGEAIWVTRRDGTARIERVLRVVAGGKRDALCAIAPNGGEDPVNLAPYAVGDAYEGPDSDADEGHGEDCACRACADEGDDAENLAERRADAGDALDDFLSGL